MPLIPTILQCLLTLEETAEDKFSLSSCQILKHPVWLVSIGRGEFAGPIFNVEAVSSFADPWRERIKGKFRKEYETRLTCPPKTGPLAGLELTPFCFTSSAP